MAALNDELRSGGEINAETARRMGLLVVSRLAKRHGIFVELERNTRGGVTASVVLPTPILRLPGQTPQPLKPVPAPAEPVSALAAFTAASQADDGEDVAASDGEEAAETVDEPAAEADRGSWLLSRPPAIAAAMAPAATSPLRLSRCPCVRSPVAPHRLPPQAWPRGCRACGRPARRPT